MVRYSFWTSRQGLSVFLAASERGLCRLNFADRQSLTELLDDLRHHGAGSCEEVLATAFTPYVPLLDDYLSGRSREFRPALDLAYSPKAPFYRKIWELMQHLGPGATDSYGALASKIGNPKASRAVGQACAKNPLLIAIPCHRVLGADGRVGHYAAGADMKRRLLLLEGRSDLVA